MSKKTAQTVKNKIKKTRKQKKWKKEKKGKKNRKGKKGKQGLQEPYLVKKIDIDQTKVSIDSFQRYWWSKNPVIWLDGRHNWPHTTKSSSLTYYFPLLTVCMQKKLRDRSILFRDNWWSKNPAIWLDEKHNQPHIQPKRVVSQVTFPWWLFPFKKN